MNKKLLLILSILMSLSLFTISCAKSVAAPDTKDSNYTLTDENIFSALSSVKIMLNTEELFWFQLGNFQPDSTEFLVQSQLSGTEAEYLYVDSNLVLDQLITKLQDASNGEISFLPSNKWIEEGSTDKDRYIYVDIMGKYGNIVRTIILHLRVSSSYASWY